MHKNIFAYLMLLMSTNLFAQNYDINENIDHFSNSIDFSKVQFGIKITPAISWIEANHSELKVEGAAMKIGAGIVADYPLTENLSIVSGINYHSFGGYVNDYNSYNMSVDTLATYKLNYKEIEIPFVLKIQTNEIRKTSYFIQGGVSIGFVLDANEEYFPVNTSLDPKYKNINNLKNQTRGAYQAGVGMNYHILGNTKIFGLISYNNSISSIANSNNYTTGTNPRYNTSIEIFTGSMEFSLGIMF